MLVSLALSLPPGDGRTVEVLYGQKLRPVPAGIGISAGSDVAIDGDFAVVGAEALDVGGRAFVFRYSGGEWVQDGSLAPSDGNDGDRFGSAVGISGAYVLVGAPSDDDFGQNAGSVYIFERASSGWREIGKLTPAQSTAEQSFGWAIDFEGDRALIGANSIGSDTLPGAAYVFDLQDGQWLETKIVPDDSQPKNLFGTSVALDGGTAVIGAPRYDVATGFAYIFEYADGHWSQSTRLEPADTQAAFFGGAVAIDGGHLIVGADQTDGGAHSTGAIYIFSKSTGYWQQTQQIASPVQEANTSFGQSIDLQGNHLAVGGRSYEGDPPAVFLFEYDGNAWHEHSTFPMASAGSGLNKVALMDARLLAGVNPSNENHTGVVAYQHDGAAWSMASSFVLGDPNSSRSSRFGQTIALDGTRALVNAFAAREVYEFRNDGQRWVMEELISSTTPRFGFGIGISQDRALISGDSGTETPGVTFYERTSEGWVERQLLKDPSGRHAFEWYFGDSISMTHDLAIIGSSGWNRISGAAYLYQFDTGAWQQLQRIQASDASDGDRFGESVKLNGTRAVIGAPGNSNAEFRAGAAYLFEFDGSSWVQVQRFQASDPEPYAAFGQSVSMYSDTVVVGAPGRHGAVYVFTDDGAGWVETKLSDPSLGRLANLGDAVEILGDVLIAGAGGARGFGVNGELSGAIYRFHRDGVDWTGTRMAPIDSASEDEWGARIALSGQQLLIGGQGDDDHGRDSGSVLAVNLDVVMGNGFESAY
ncbi:MAG: hypothetical protein QNJ40_26605 [Xanthomonadales bacterium]|nr:hypothetical protein [Xanthomonadales bacterium]